MYILTRVNLIYPLCSEIPCIGIHLSRIGALQYGQVWSSIQSLHITCSECWSHWNVTSSLDISPLHKEHCSRLFEEFFDADFGKSSFGFWASLGLVSGTLSTELLAELDSLKKNDDNRKKNKLYLRTQIIPDIFYKSICTLISNLPG